METVSKVRELIYDKSKEEVLEALESIEEWSCVKI